jgi:hypothetical protein
MARAYMPSVPRTKIKNTIICAWPLHSHKNRCTTPPPPPPPPTLLLLLLVFLHAKRAHYAEGSLPGFRV